MARPPRRPDRPAGHPAWPARVGAAALIRVARAVQRAAEALAPAAHPAAAAPPPEPPPRKPGQPPEHWLALVREHAPQLLIGRDPAELGDPASEPSIGREHPADQPAPPRYADPLAVPPRTMPMPADGGRKAAALVPGSAAAPVAAAITTASAAPPVRPSSALPSHVTDDDRAAGRTTPRTSAERVAPARVWQRLSGEVWARLSGKARTQTPPAEPAVHSGQAEKAVPAMRLSSTPTQDRFPAWSWIGPSEADRARAPYLSTAAQWPRLPAVNGKPEREPDEVPDAELPWPDLPDDTPLWTMPTPGYSAEHLARLDREQAG